MFPVCQKRLFFLLSALLPAVATAEIVDGVALVVNGEVLTLSEVEERAGRQLPPPSADPAVLQRRKEILKRVGEELVAEKLVEKQADELGLLPSEPEIDAAIQEVVRANKIDEATLGAALAQQGLTMDKYREMLSSQLARMKLVEMKVKSRVQVSEDDVKARYQQLVKDVSESVERQVKDAFVPNAGDPEAAKNKANTLRSRLLAGEAFETVAAELGTPIDLGWVGPGMVLPELEAAMAGLKKGGVSAVVQAGPGFHVLLVEDVKSSGGARPLSEARDEIRNQLLGERLAKATEVYVQELVREATVEWKLP